MRPLPDRMGGRGRIAHAVLQGGDNRATMTVEDRARSPVAFEKEDAEASVRAVAVPRTGDASPASPAEGAGLQAADVAAEQNDAIAELYHRCKEMHSWRRDVEEHSLMKLAGDLRGLKVADLACGSGHYTRKLQAAGAAQVVGVDISPEMVAIARGIESREPLGVEYLCLDATQPLPFGDRDLVFAAFLLNYADSYSMLAAFVRTIHQALRDGGRFVSVNDNFAQDPSRYADCRRHLFEKTLPQGSRFSGATIRYTLMDALTGREFGFDNYWLPEEDYRRAFREAGFRSVRFVPLSASPDAEDNYDDLIEAQPFVLIEACK